MIITIIITALATLTLTFLVGYFIWSIRGIKKLKKQAKDNKQNIEYNRDDYRRIEEDLINMMNDKIGYVEDNLNDKISENEDSAYKSREDINVRIDEVDEKLDTASEDNWTMVNNTENRIIKQLDTRLNKVHEKFDEYKLKKNKK